MNRRNEIYNPMTMLILPLYIRTDLTVEILMIINEFLKPNYRKLYNWVLNQMVYHFDYNHYFSRDIFPYRLNSDIPEAFCIKMCLINIKRHFPYLSIKSYIEVVKNLENAIHSEYCKSSNCIFCLRKQGYINRIIWEKRVLFTICNLYIRHINKVANSQQRY
jgi:hypothetical protein